MAVEAVSKINLISLDKHKDQILDLLYNAGVVEILESAEAKDNVNSELEYNLAQVKFALKFLKKYEKKVPLLKKFQGDKINLTENKFKNIIEDFNYRKIVDEIADLEAEINKAKNNITKYNTEIESLSIWKNLEIAPEEIGETEFTHSVLGGFTKENYEEFQEKTKQLEKYIHIEKIAEDEKNQYILINSEKKTYSKIKKILVDLNWEESLLPYSDQIPKKAIISLENKISKLEKNIIKIEKEITTYAKHDDNLKVVYDFLNWQLEKNEASHSSLNTQESFALKCWIENEHLEQLKSAIEKFTHEYVIEELPIKKEDNIPVPLQNNKLFYPFESVTGIYGMPLPKEPDPTPYLTGFFVIFFGMCLTDAGYGIILALFSFLAIKIFKIPKEKSKLFVVLIWGGFFTFIIGALFGGWFGLNIATELPAGISAFLQKIQIIDPIKNPITVLIVTLIMGIIQLLFGIGIAMFWKIKHGHVWDGILDHGTWMYFILAIMFWITTKVGVLPASLSQIALWSVIAGVALLILTQGRKEKNIFMKILKGIGSLYGLVGLFSDTLSYSRLLALGLATGIIAMVVNMIGLLVADMVPYVGWVIAIVIFIGGHLFNMVINVLGAYIHSSRLQFVEFFGQFMEGGGVRFKPFKKEAKFITFSDK